MDPLYDENKDVFKGPLVDEEEMDSDQTIGEPEATSVDPIVEEEAMTNDEVEIAKE
ncbi:hypothetical protein DEO72_LG8g1707 [Vigna unguiculata]|uniref:Uncharacterized protein n=1 Tax=Vigna unguiculata TaxID=3917 RepID=A0A4D6MST0_VIGUN|nr:hypothetical protein DEO72_LG8g1707 [Vigna unguiculata]